MTRPSSPGSEASPPPESDAHLFRVALTGGPCGGKTTALVEVSERLRARGVNAFVVPEAATILFTGGATALDFSHEPHTLAMQSALLRAQLSLEDSFADIARGLGGRAVLLCDRGALDGRAYMSGALWQRMLSENGHDEGALRDGRYDLVIHMVTAADGAPEFYTIANNGARRESPEQARAQDRRTRDAWVGHPHLRIIDNSTGFRAKIDRVFHVVADLIGVPAPSWLVRKFLVSRALVPPGAIKAFDVKQTFLKRTHGAVESVRLRCDGSTRTFVHKVRHGSFDTKRQITNREYLPLLAHADPDKRMVSIRRSCFAHGSNYFVMDKIVNVKPCITLVRCHVEEGGKVAFPDWLQVEKEVTGEFNYTVYAMSSMVTPTRIRTETEGKIIERPTHYTFEDIALAKSL